MRFSDLTEHARLLASEFTRAVRASSSQTRAITMHQHCEAIVGQSRDLQPITLF